jgi:hypothetical protein
MSIPAIYVVRTTEEGPSPSGTPIKWEAYCSALVKPDEANEAEQLSLVP